VGSLDSGDLGLLLRETLGDEGAKPIVRWDDHREMMIDVLVFGLLFLLVCYSAGLDGVEVTATLETERGDQALDLGTAYERLAQNRRDKSKVDIRLGVGLRILLLRALNLPSHNVLPNIILLAQVEELANLGRPLGTQSLGQHHIRQAGDLLLTLLDDDQRENGDVRTDDASTHGLALAFTGAAGAVARVTIGEEEADTEGDENTLFHWETLLVVSACDAEDVAFPFVA
jgi:hypothetical protein